MPHLLLLTKLVWGAFAAAVVIVFAGLVYVGLYLAEGGSD